MNGPWLTSATWLLHSAIGGGLLLLLGWTGMRWCRQPARQQRLGEAALLAALLLAILSVGPPWLIVPLLEPQPPAQGEASTPSAPPSPLPSTPGQSEEHFVWLPPNDQELRHHDVVRPEPSGTDAGRFVLAFGPFRPRPTTDFAATQSDVPAAVPLPNREADLNPDPEVSMPGQAADSPAPFSLVRVAAWLGTSYLLIGTFLLGRWLLGYFALWRLFRAAHPAPEDVARLFATMVGDRRVPRLLVSSRLRVPLSCGLLRPTVVVPAALCEPQVAPTLRWVFAHELTHLERRDAWACLLFGLGQALYFYLPWFWWLRRQVRLCQEYIADAAAAEQTVDAVAYAQFLLSLTTAPAVPVSATGVSGHSSDLFRRVTMLLQSPLRVERGCPRWWSLVAGGGLLTLAVVVSGIGLRADAALTPQLEQDEITGLEPKPPLPAEVVAVVVEDPKPGSNDDAKKDKSGKDDKSRRKGGTLEIPWPDLDELLKKLPAGADPEQLKQARDQLQKARDQMQKAIEQLQKQTRDIEEEIRKATRAATEAARQATRSSSTARVLTAGQGRLGILVEKPSETLADQLDLPRGQGLVIQQVQPNTPAARAGLKANDILLELDGKAVASDAAQFIRSLEEIKAGKAVNAVVLRKGKRQTIRGIELAEGGARPGVSARSGASGLGSGASGLGALPNVPQGTLSQFRFENLGQLQGMAGQALIGRGGVMTTTFRTDDHFTTRHQEGSLVITVTGNVTDSKAKVTEITVQDGKESHKYQSLDRVPEQYRDKVKNLTDMTEKSNIKIEIRTRPEKRKTDKSDDEEQNAPVPNRLNRINSILN